MSFLLVANFKSNKDQESVGEWCKEVASIQKSAKLKVIVAPSHLHLRQVYDSGLSVAAQDVSPFPPGSYTGAVSAPQLKDIGVQYALVGHSERRRYFHESHSDIANKVDILNQTGLVPLICLREEDIVGQAAALSGVDHQHSYFCFEPESAIGSGEMMQVTEIQKYLALIKQNFGDKAKVIYGGSVDLLNIEALQSLELDGLLVSSAALDSRNFITLISKLNGT